MHPSNDPPKKRRLPKWLVPAAGYSIAIASLIWVFHAFDYHQLAQDLRTLHWEWVLLGIVLNIAVYLVDAWRWSVLLRPAEIVPFDECVKAIFVGLVANGVLPAKAGEVVRCYLLSLWTEMPVALALTSDAISRVMDGIWLVVGFYLVTIGLHPPTHRLEKEFMLWRDGTFVLMISVAILSSLIVFVLFRREHASSFVKSNKWAERFAHLMHEIHELGDVRSLTMAMGISVLYLLLPILSVWCLFRAYDFDFGLVQAGIVLIVVHIGTILPNAPANIGSFQAFATVALGIIRAEQSAAASFALIFYIAHTLPQILVGFVVLLFTGLNLGEVHTRAIHAEHARKTRIPEPLATNSGE
jgi:glycosyltransferase 2 family protein